MHAIGTRLKGMCVHFKDINQEIPLEKDLIFKRTKWKLTRKYHLNKWNTNTEVYVLRQSKYPVWLEQSSSGKRWDWRSKRGQSSWQQEKQPGFYSMVKGSHWKIWPVKFMIWLILLSHYVEDGMQRSKSGGRKASWLLHIHIQYCTCHITRQWIMNQVSLEGFVKVISLLTQKRLIRGKGLFLFVSPNLSLISASPYSLPLKVVIMTKLKQWKKQVTILQLAEQKNGKRLGLVELVEQLNQS